MTSQPLLSQLLRQAGTALCAISLVGCAVGPDFVKPDDRLASVQLSPRADYAPPNETSAANFPSSWRSEEHTSELQSLMRISYAVFCLKKKKTYKTKQIKKYTNNSTSIVTY